MASTVAISQSIASTRSTDPTPARTITWERLIELEPRLADLYRRAKNVRDDKRRRPFCANRVWKGRGHKLSFRDEVTRLVGHWAETEHEELKTSLAYTTAYQRIYDALPPCRNCACLALWEVVGFRKRDRAR